MPTRYRTTLIVTDAGGGLLRVWLGHPAADGFEHGGLAFVGEKPVAPPGRDLTPGQLDEWKDGLRAAGYQEVFPPAADPLGWCPVVEAVRTVEDEVPPGAITWELCRLAAAADRRPTLGVWVRSSWLRPIPAVRLNTSYAADWNLPVPRAPAALGLRDAGEGTETLERVPDPNRRLPAELNDALVCGVPVLFALDPDFYPLVRERAAVLSPEQHRIELRTHGYEFARIGGGEIAAFLDTTAE